MSITLEEAKSEIIEEIKRCEVMISISRKALSHQPQHADLHNKTITQYTGFITRLDEILIRNNDTEIRAEALKIIEKEAAGIARAQEYIRRNKSGCLGIVLLLVLLSGLAML